MPRRAYSNRSPTRTAASSPQATHDRELPADHKLASEREIIRQSLNEITAELDSALAAAGLACPVYMCIPTGSIMTTTNGLGSPRSLFKSWARNWQNTTANTRTRLCNGLRDDGGGGSGDRSTLVVSRSERQPHNGGDTNKRRWSSDRTGQIVSRHPERHARLFQHHPRGLSASQNKSIRRRPHSAR
jgi:hypothetical protein